MSYVHDSNLEFKCHYFKCETGMYIINPTVLNVYYVTKNNTLCNLSAWMKWNSMAVKNRISGI